MHVKLCGRWVAELRLSMLRADMLGEYKRVSHDVMRLIGVVIGIKSPSEDIAQKDPSYPLLLLGHSPLTRSVACPRALILSLSAEPRIKTDLAKGVSPLYRRKICIQGVSKRLGHDFQ